MAALDVLSLDEAKQHLNMTSDEDDAELVGFIGAAVERVERHTGHTLSSSSDASASELLAVKIVLASYWETQRVTLGGASAGQYAYGSAPVDDDSPMGGASLQMKLNELLGYARSEAPTGSFPDPQPWPDPVRWCRW